MATTKRVRFDLIDKYIKRTMKTTLIPGLSIGITDRERTLWVASYGCSELESERKVAPGDLFEIGSISKFFSVIVLMQLRDKGLVDLDRPVTDYLPWFKVKSRYAPITLHHLLTHTAGLVIGQEESPEGVPEVWSLRCTEASTPPGEHFHYSNHGYKTVGLVIEKLTGRSCGDMVRDRVLRPLGMNSTEPVIANDVRSRLVVGYGPSLDDRPLTSPSRLAPAAWFESGTADGTICSNPSDMCRHLRMILHGGALPNGGRLMSVDSFKLMTAPHIKPEDGYHGESYGYGMNVGQLDGHSCLWHTGGMVGYHASIVVDVDSGLGVVTLINGPGTPEEISFFALKTVRACLEDATLPKVPPMSPIKEVEDAGQYAGKYSSPEGTVRVVPSGKELWLVRDGKRSRLEPTAPDKFNSSDVSELFPFRFGRNDGVVTELFNGPEWYTNDRYRGPRRFPSRKEWEPFPGHYRSYSPWSSNFRVVLRKGQLAIIEPQGDEEPLVPLAEGWFRIGADPKCPERIRFEMMVDGKAHMAFRSGGRAYRSFTP